MINTLDMRIWGREFNLPVKYDCYKGEVVTEEQKKAITDFKNHQDWIDMSKNLIEDYCHDKAMGDDENLKKDDIFSYIKPEYLFVKREDKPRILLMCKYRYDLERGVAVVFSSDKDVFVGPQDMILK